MWTFSKIVYCTCKSIKCTSLCDLSSFLLLVEEGFQTPFHINFFGIHRESESYADRLICFKFKNLYRIFSYFLYAAGLRQTKKIKRFAFSWCFLAFSIPSWKSILIDNTSRCDANYSFFLQTNISIEVIISTTVFIPTVKHISIVYWVI